MKTRACSSKFLVYGLGILCLVRGTLQANASGFNTEQLAKGGRMMVEGITTALKGTFGIQSKESLTNEVSHVAMVLAFFILLDMWRNHPITSILKDTTGMIKDAAFIAVLIQMLEILGTKGRIPRLNRAAEGTERSSEKSEYVLSPFLRTIISYRLFNEWKLSRDLGVSVAEPTR